jgi:uncharacterized protein YpuA (DUF1002 family)
MEKKLITSDDIEKIVDKVHETYKKNLENQEMKIYEMTNKYQSLLVESAKKDLYIEKLEKQLKKIYKI